MRQTLLAAWFGALLLASSSARGDPKALPSANDVIVDLVFGQCLSEVTRSPPSSDSIDPHALGRPVDPKTPDPRLSPQAVRIPTAAGAVYFDHHGTACEVFASDIDAVIATRKIQEGFDGLDAPVTALAPTPSTAGDPADRTVSFALGTLEAEPTVPNLTISYPLAQPTSLSARMSLSRQINLTTDSAPGWLPTDDQVRAAMDAVHGFLDSMDQGRAEAAYALLGEDMKRAQPPADFTAALGQFNAKAGPVQSRRIVRVTWTKDPAQAPLPGVYAAIDLVSRFANIDRHCGYIVLYQAPAGGGFTVMRREDNFMDNATARDIEKQHSSLQVDTTWAQASRNCPNYPE